MKNNVRDVLVIFEVEADLNLILEVKLVDESM
jgi:hypothetical protein